MHISTVIACGTKSNNKPKETPKKSSISDYVKSTIEQVVIESDKTIEQLNDISANTEKS